MYRGVDDDTSKVQYDMNHHEHIAPEGPVHEIINCINEDMKTMYVIK